MKIFILSGSVGKKSCTRTLLHYIENLLQEFEGVETVFWDLAEKPLPIAIPEYHARHHEHPEPVVREFVHAVEAADGFLLGSPLYHDSFSGVLKNALDNLPNDAFSGKPAAMVSHSSNARSCVIPCYHLRPVVRSLGGYPAQTQIGTTDEDYREIKGTLEVVGSSIISRAERLAGELVKLADVLKRMERNHGPIKH